MAEPKQWKLKFVLDKSLGNINEEALIEILHHSFTQFESVDGYDFNDPQIKFINVPPKGKQGVDESLIEVVFALSSINTVLQAAGYTNTLKNYVANMILRIRKYLSARNTYVETMDKNDEIITRACHQLSQITQAAKWIPPRKAQARLS